ncbi:response regulator [Photobacterium japonica]|uniref:response regulator n=1 Tax=Photobacterium japonica TaxID=2910235 RepID=UPI003D10D601
MSTPTALPLSAHILIVDDQPSAAMMLKSVLHTLGVKTVDIAHDHRQAISQCRKHAYHLLFVDYHLDGPITGPELLHLLKKRQHITTHCGIIMLSGDRSTEVILTGLTMAPDGFLTKPITTQRVQKALTTTLHNVMQRQPIHDAIAGGDITSAITLCQQTLSRTGYQPKLAEHLWALLRQTGQWEALFASLTQWKTHPPSAQWQRFTAYCHHQRGDHQQAIACIEAQITRTPLQLELYDDLADYLTQSGQYHRALQIAKEAQAFTPSIQHRVLTVATLAAYTDNVALLIKTGRTLANHLSIIDVGWIVSLAKYFAIFERTYFAHSSVAFRRELKQALKGIDHKASLRILPAQRPYLTCYGHIMMARLQLGNQQALKAKRRVMVGLSRYFNQLSRLPSVVLADVLPLLLHLGETQLIAACRRVLASRDQFDDHSVQRLQALKQNTVLIQAISPLESQLHDAHTLLTLAPHQAIGRYKAILQHYPLCSEANLGYLQCQLALGQACDSHALQAISAMPLPDNLADWRQRLLVQWREIAAVHTINAPTWNTRPSNGTHQQPPRMPSFNHLLNRNKRITAFLPPPIPSIS